MMHAMNTALFTLAISALRAICLAGIAALAISGLRAKSTSARIFVWRAVLMLALAMPFLGQLAPPLSISIPAFAQLATLQPTIRQIIEESSPNDSVATRLETDGTQAQSAEAALASLPSVAPPTPTEQPRPTSSFQFRWTLTMWNVLTVAIYLIVASIFLARLILGCVLSRRLVCTSVIVTDPKLCPRLDSLKRRSTPRIGESALVSVPVTVGLFRPTVLLPSCWREWDDSKLNAVIAHEASHVVRHDALVQHISLLHRAIFWFSPLAWWLDRHLSELAEEASDEAALVKGANREDYARTVLGFFEDLQTAPGRVWWQGVSMAQRGQAEQRLEKIMSWRGPVTMNLKKSLVVAIAVVSIPAVYLVASVRPAGQGQLASLAPESQTADRVSTRRPAPPSVVEPNLGAPADGVSVSRPRPAGTVAPVMSVATVAPNSVVVPVAPVSSYALSAKSYSSGQENSYAYGYDDEDRFIIVSGKSDSFTMSGSAQDIHHVERLKKQIPGDFIWFQRDEKSYIIRDQATIDRAKAFWAPQEELGKKQAALGKQQEALGKQQEALGEKMEQVRVNVPPDLTAKLDALKARLQKLGPSATMEEIGDLQSEIGELQGQVGDIQGRAGEQQGKLGEEQGKLGEQQGKLGEEQGKLGEEQGRLAEEAAKKTKALFDEAVKNGKAQPEPDGSHGASL
ncbi:MAG: M56 family metallopeptidase [Candidatus Sulfotelmatobacter sp.]